MIRQNLHRDVSLQSSVAGSIHFPHAARAQWGNDFVRSKPGSRRERHSISLLKASVLRFPVYYFRLEGSAPIEAQNHRDR